MKSITSFVFLIFFCFVASADTAFAIQAVIVGIMAATAVCIPIIIFWGICRLIKRKFSSVSEKPK